MTVWRYVAIPDDGGARQRGELAGASASEVRSALRRIGLQVVDLRPLRGSRERSGPSRLAPLRESLDVWRRGRRRHLRAELYDGLATMLDSGVPLLEAVETLLAGASSAARRTMLRHLQQGLRAGGTLSEAMADHPDWFDVSEIAMVRSAQHAGTLPSVLRSLAERHERSGELAQRLAGALTYPAVVAAVGVGVVVFLSVRTLPMLTNVLTDAGIETPPLTSAVMAFGQGLARRWPFGIVIVPLLALGLVAARRAALTNAPAVRRMSRLTPRVLRRMAVARLADQLAELLGAGVPMVEALRVIEPTLGRQGLRLAVRTAIERVEQGATLAAALDDPDWFDAEFRRLLQVGETSGELESLLERIAARTNRQSARLIDRLASLLEPAVILVLATLIGIVVMAAILPLLRLQEIV